MGNLESSNNPKACFVLVFLESGKKTKYKRKTHASTVEENTQTPSSNHRAAKIMSLSPKSKYTKAAVNT